MATQIVLTLEQRKELTTIPDNITDDDLMTFCVFDETDRKNILGLRREFYGSIGYAVQLFCLRYTGWRYDNETQIPRKVLNFIATQLELKEPST